MRCCRVITGALLAAIVGCGDSATDLSREATRLKVGAGQGLGTLNPPDVSGSLAAAVELVYIPLEPHVVIDEREGHSIILRITSTRYRAEELQESIVHGDVVAVRALDAERVRLDFTEAEAADRFALRFAAIDGGPFELQTQTNDYVVFAARDDTSRVDEIVLVRSLAGDQWRRLLARDIDVIPVGASVYRKHLEGMHTIRLIDYPSHNLAALYFNLDRLRSPGSRRALAKAIDRPALALLACGTAACAVDQPVMNEEREVELPSELHLIVLDSDEPLLDAARALRIQLARVDVAVEIEALPLPDLISRHERADFDLALAPMPPSETGLQALAGRDRRNIPGYESERFRAAVAAGDYAEARRILAEDLPVLPLFERRHFAAVDARFCGGEPEVIWSWAWLADLYPCEEGR